MKSKTYDEFVEKFKPKKTTDDCYTPPIVYDSIADYVAQKYQLDRSTFCRPFYPGGDYENFDYNNRIVVDNPPFSILSKILKFYTDNDIKFFLFAPHITAIGSLKTKPGTIIAIDVNVIYENGACVNTDFITNLEPSEIYIKSDPELFAIISEAVKKTQNKNTTPKYKYPSNVVTTRDFGNFSKYGINLKILRSECYVISKLDSQKENKKTIYGAGLLVSDRVASLKSKAQAQAQAQARANAQPDFVWSISEREHDIINNLNQMKGGTQ